MLPIFLRCINFFNLHNFAILRNLRKAVATSFSLPFSNESVDGLFSSLKLVKTSFRSSLKRETLVGLIHTNQEMKTLGIHAHQIKLDGMLVELVKKVKSRATDSHAGN